MSWGSAYLERRRDLTRRGPPTLTGRPRRGLLPWAAVIGLIFVLFAGATLLTKRPWVDEAWFTSPGLDLVVHGRLGTLLLDPAGSNLRLLNPGAVLKGIDQHTYWVMPLHLLQLALWGRMFGFSVFSIRIPGVLWGLIAIASLAIIIRRLYPENRDAAIVGAAVLAMDFGFVTFAADGRMDMMCSALGFAALAVYLSLRTVNFQLAVALSHVIAAAACFTHPNGVFGSAALLLAMGWLDRRRVRPMTAALVVAPYVLGTAMWALYCAQAPADFMAQFSANGAGRLSDALAPWRGVWREIRGRYLTHYWPGYSVSGKLKITGLILTISAVAAFGALPALRRSDGCRLLLALTGLRFVCLSVGASVKYTYYLVHIIPYFAALIGIAITYAWYSGGVKIRLPGAAALAVYFGVQASALFHSAVSLHSYQEEYAPLIRYLRSNIRADDLVAGSAELGFGLGFFNPRLVDDVWLGYWSGRQPTMVVVDPTYYAEVFKTATRKGMPSPHYFDEMLHSRYILIAEIQGCRIYRRSEANASASAATVRAGG